MVLTEICCPSSLARWQYNNIQKYGNQPGTEAFFFFFFFLAHVQVSDSGNFIFKCQN